jgi:hypothetical protein
LRLAIVGTIARRLVGVGLWLSAACGDATDAADPLRDDGASTDGVASSATAGDAEDAPGSSGTEGDGADDAPGESGDAPAGDGGDCVQQPPVEACEPPPPPHYVGNQYDVQGVRTSIDGPVEVVDAIAADIAAVGTQIVADVAAARATLPYGALEPDPCAAPQVVTYPGPPGIPVSDQYEVTVEGADGQVHDAFVHKILARKPDTNRELDSSWASFSFAGPVTVRVRKLGGAPTDCMVRPYQANIATSFADGVCTFSLDRPRNVSVEFYPEVHNPIPHPMLVFANPLEVDVPDPTDPNVVMFGPGVHDIGAGYPIESGKTYYVAGGAWVNGAFIANGPVQDVIFKGRGIVSGLFMDTGNQAANKDVPGLIDIKYGGSENILVEGVTFVDAPRFNVRALGHHTTIHNIKTMSWWFSTDGVVAGTHSVIEDNFIKVNDDSIKLHWDGTVARRNVLWQLENGGTFNLSWNIHADSNTFWVYDNDVIHVEHYLFDAQAIFRSRHAGSGHIHRYFFDDIRIENASWRLFYLMIENNKWYDPAQGYGEISQVVFRNIHAFTSYQRPNVIQGWDGQHKVRNVAFQNVWAEDRCFDSRDSGNFAIDPGSTHAIRIMRSADETCWTPSCPHLP